MSWIGQLDKTYAWRLLMAFNIFMKAFNHLLYIETSKHPIFYLTKTSIAKIADFDVARIFKEDEIATTQHIVGTM
jgi:hypothetical protein